ncbi:MAG: RdgB/HAM1 family non-canonical purine NTP pyrophosphatase [Planctomycetes bacterium]|nr:RdgB/HAM1 family non-canonical purine NTP pyrophosphatase [Planctomycetota bacterium]
MDNARLVLATTNAHKLTEIRHLLGDLPIEVTSLADHPGVEAPAETGADFEANAALKAESVCAATGCWALADDSGLEVDALQGRPGVHSKRFGGPAATDADNNRKLLGELAALPVEARAARFVSVVALARPGEATLTVRGEVAGRILTEPRGRGGFGYDPLFYYPPFERTFGELPLEQKNRVSHRGAALTAMRSRIRQLLNGEAVAGAEEVAEAPGPPAAAAGDPGHPAMWTRPARAGEDAIGGLDPRFLVREADEVRAETAARRARGLEYVEAIVVALVMALILREFFFEAFKIPTPSMAPTLRGAPELGDRILVDKLVYRLRPPRRWEVIVFRYPLNETTNYIKRLVGLPGETVRIVDGDIWVNGEIARKPLELQDAIWIPLFPVSRDPHGSLDGHYRPPGRFEDESGRPPADGAWTAAPGPDGPAVRLRYAFDARAVRGADWRYGAPELEPGRSGVRDFRIDGTLRLDGADAEAGVRLEVRGVEHVVQLRTGGEGAAVDPPRRTRHGARTPVASRLEPGRGRRLEPGRPVRVSVMHFDHQLVVRVAGALWFHHVFAPDAAGRTLHLDASTLTLELGRAGGAWSALAVYRDIHYTESGFERTVPPDSYLVLGDNSTDSKDSRRWRKSVRRLRDGRLIEYEEDERAAAAPRFAARPPEIVDVLGNRYGHDEIDWRFGATHEPAPFVARRLLIGRAFLIFFPWPPFYNEEFRPGLIR